jgi:Peptidase A4 family
LAAAAAATTVLGGLGVRAGSAADRPLPESHNWSGYVEFGGSFTAVRGTFNIPNLGASPNSTATSEWVGIDGATTDHPSLIQAGVDEAYDPATNLVRLYAWWEILPARETVVPLRVRVGDRISVLVGRVANGLWTIEIRDDTSGRKFTTTKPYAGPESSAEWIVEAPTSASGRITTLGHYVPDVRFSDLRFGGASQHSLDELQIVQDGSVLSTPSALTSDGFAVAYGGVQPPAP